MNFEVFFIEPEPGYIVEIYTPVRFHHFLTGYCRRVMQTPTHLHFFEGFKRVSDIDLTHCRAELCEWVCVPLTKASIGFAPEQPWMRLTEFPKQKPSDSNSQPEQ